ncbi:unnamed protein product [Lota lota]
MDAGSSDRVEYNRWNEENINIDVAASQPGLMGFYNRVCTGSMGLVIKVAGGVAALVSVYLLGYVTGYYVHKCP